MNGKYVATILFWPFSTHAGTEADQKACGDREQKFEFAAADFEDAHKQVKLLLRGIKTNPRLWKAPIKSIVYKELNE
jgi:hypothetical protein